MSGGRGLHFSLSGVFIRVFRLAGKRCSLCRCHMLFTASDTEVFIFERTEQDQFTSRSAVGSGAIDCGFGLELLCFLKPFLKPFLQLQFKDASVISKSLQAYVHMSHIDHFHFGDIISVYPGGRSTSNFFQTELFLRKEKYFIII